MGRKIVVIGGSGLIGHALVSELSHVTDSLTVLDTRPPANARPVPGAEYIIDKLPSLSLRVLKTADIVFHLAGYTENRPHEGEFRNHTLESVLLAADVLDAFSSSEGRLIAASSQLVYSPHAISPNEDEPRRPLSAFGAAKAAMEHMIDVWASVEDRSASIARLSNIVGPRMRRGLIYDVARQISSGAQEVVLLGDGEQRRSYLHVTDCASALVRLADVESHGARSFNVANSDELSSRDVAECVVAAMGSEATVRCSQSTVSWRGDSPNLLPDTTRLHEFGWRPRWSGRQAVSETASRINANDRE